MISSDERLLKVCLWNGSQTDRANRRIAQELLRGATDFGVQAATGMPMTEGGGHGQVYRSAAVEASASDLPLVLRFFDERQRIQRWAEVCAISVRESGVVVVGAAKSWPPKVTRSINERASERAPKRETSVSRSGGETMKERGLSLWRKTDGKIHATAAVEVEVYTTEARVIDGRPVYQVVVDWAKAEGIAWISVERAGFGYGAMRLWQRADGLIRRRAAPVLVTLIDTDAALAPKISALSEKLHGEAVVVSKSVTWYRADGQ